MNKKRTALTALVVFAVVVLGCPLGLLTACRNSSPSHVVADAKLSVKEVREFESLFPGSNHWISYYTGYYGHPQWNSEVGLFGRYVLTMQAEVDLNLVRSRIVRFATPTFLLVEVSTVETLPDGRTATTYSGLQRDFGLVEWDRLVRASGDLKVLGFEPKTDKPIPGFDRALTPR